MQAPGLPPNLLSNTFMSGGSMGSMSQMSGLLPNLNLGGPPLATPSIPLGPQEAKLQEEKIYALVHELTIPEKRESALLELSKKREAVADLAPILWYSIGTIAALLQEIVAIYPLLSPPKLKAHASNRVCNALALLQCVASHPDTRTLFLNAHVPLFFVSFSEYGEQNAAL
eukprot:TRINITY_DN6585_c0_g1_i1.p2 TRINITY_DN6585_c0_g1~~TRINITY_DN6585_c0_g1_i1.p2  ORF type:complete len:171 (+),score=34.10 TRINITY_DN6585_c0_g1_i1:255-767(+)